MADSVLLGTAIALLAYLFSWLFRHKSAATRFAVMMTALVAMASLPLIRLAMNVGPSGTEGASLLQVADSWAPWILAAWAVIASVGLARVGAALWGLRRMRRTCRALESPALRQLFNDALAQFCPARKVQILVSRDVAVPAAMGFFRPAVVLPSWVIEEMSVPEIRHVVVHELSHLRRWDDWSNLLQQIVKAMLFFHPAVWWLESRLSLEREMACDDAVLTGSTNPRSYAECLAHIAERNFLRRGLAMAQAAVSRVRQTSRRVARILQIQGPTGAPTSKLTVAFAAAFALSALGVLWHAPLLVSFDTNGATAAKLSQPDEPAPAPQTVKAAWHPRVARPEPRVQPSEHPTNAKARGTPDVRPRLLPARMTAERAAFTETVVVFVVQGNDGIAVWQLTTWQFSPSRQLRAARKTT